MATGIQKAIEIAGGIRPLARLTGISVSQVNGWHKRGWVAPQRCLAVHAATLVPLHELNPKVYPTWEAK